MMYNVNTICEQYGIALAECTSTVFCIWPDDGSTEPNHVAEFLILLPIHVVLLNK